ncbi:uncharacterized protein [Arachis hypogaea]|uniref:uncharacterized protein n=1 Tax=Arachis hypogaea TaxID=3818 RepID=UPI000DEC7C51|nr:uncharacterized protein LOC112799627 [Arachis hypogaea]QHO41336.1 uncharacterized protein DS421_5g144820 [Arachis hypogaea]
MGLVVEENHLVIYPMQESPLIRLVERKLFMSLLIQERNLKGAVSGKAKKCGKKALDVSINGHSEKSVTARRKALSDISNSVVEPPPLDFDVFEELGMLHDHSKCLSNFSPLSEAELLSDESENPHIELEEEEEYYGLQSETEPEIYIRRYRPLTPMSSPECRKLLDELEALYSDRPDARQ